MFKIKYLKIFKVFELEYVSLSELSTESGEMFLTHLLITKFVFDCDKKKHYLAIQAARVIMAPLAPIITLVDIHVHVPQDTLELIVNIVCLNRSFKKKKFS